MGKRSKEPSILFSVPESIPPCIDSLIVSQVDAFGADGIHIVQISWQGDTHYLATYYSDREGFKVKKRKWIGQDHRLNDIPVEIETELGKEQGRRAGLGKATGIWMFVWLAHFYEHYFYQGLSYRFWTWVDPDQVPLSGAGYYHKIINDLRNWIYSPDPTQVPDYTGYLNDKISSHGWPIDCPPENDPIYDYVCTPIAMSVFKNPNRSGPKYTFDGNKVYFDNDWKDEYFNGVPWEPIKDQVTSIDMFFRVERKPR